jgi:succinate-semialdehyde dehydrogenase/glutarate-semialdehyde dehydrogenase
MQQLKDPSLFRQQAFLNGQWCDADNGETIAVTNPATGDIVGTIANMGTAETRRAIEGANAAWPAWRKKTAKERGAVMRKWSELIIANADDLALIMTTEQGKPLAEAKTEVLSSAAFIDWFAEEAKRVYGETIPTPLADRRIVVIKEPIGVCAAITPWNFPSAMIARKVGPALAVGCPMVVRPAELTPFSALALAVLAERAGVPAGILTVITGSSRPIGAELTGNPTVRKLSFTGSTEVGRLLMQQCAPTVKKLSLELGGNAPFIVFDDADLDAAVSGAMASKYRNAGQTCVCANRFFVQDGIYDAFAAKFAAAAASLSIGDGREAGVNQGPMIDAKAVNKTQEFIADALEKGAKVATGGKRHALGQNFFEPTVLTDVNADMRVAREEIFGPIAPLFRFKTEEEVIKMANDTEFGLAGYFFSRDIGRVWRVAEGLECGMVGVNTGLVATEVAPFGGVKQSGLGREGSLYGVDEYVVIKYICMSGM